MDDERNTDNAWIETVALNYHDEDGSLTRNLKLRVRSVVLFPVVDLSIFLLNFVNEMNTSI